VTEYPSGTLGQFLRRLRLEKGLEQKQLAKKIGVHKLSVYCWEKDRKRPSRKSMERLVRFFRKEIV
jgi:transcriptional regulator with XRE-family HTH domain